MGGSKFDVDINRDTQERFEIFTDTDAEHLLASGSIYGGRHVYMLCNLKMLKAHSGIQQFLSMFCEEFRMPGDGSIVYADYSKWTDLRLIQGRSE